MESSGVTVIKSRNVFPVIFRKKVGLEKIVIEGLESVTLMIGIMQKYTTDIDPFTISNQILELEINLNNNEKKFMSVLNNRYYYPVCWKELLKINSECRQLFKQLAMVFNKNQIFKSIDSYTPFYEHERRFINNVKNFLEDYNKNRKYVYEILKNNQHELKDFMKLYFIRLNTVFAEQHEDCSMRIKILELFEHINDTNEEIQETISKIFVSSNM